MRIRSIVVAAVVGLALTTPALAQTAHVPEPGHLTLTPVATLQTFDQIWAGRTRMALPSDLAQRTAAVSVDFGLRDGVALDATVGYSVTESTAFGGPATDRGLSDTAVGVRWRLLNEHESGRPHAYPTLAIRVGGVIRGTYEDNRPFSVGDGGSGIEVSLLADKTLPGGIGVQQEVGYRRRNRSVPSDLVGGAGLYRSFGAATISGNYRVVQGQSGPDIGDPDFEFRLLRETDHVASAGLGVAHGGRYYQVFGAKSVRGRNTGAKVVLGAAVTFSFRVR